jgi:hypothetical protein
VAARAATRPTAPAAAREVCAGLDAAPQPPRGTHRPRPQRTRTPKPPTSTPTPKTPTTATPAGEALLQRVFAVTDTLSRLEAAGLAALAGCGEGHVRALFRRNKGALTALLGRAERRAEAQQREDDAAAAAAAREEQGEAPDHAQAEGAPAALRAGGLRPRRQASGSGAAAAAGGAAREEALLAARQRDLSRLKALLDPATGGLADAAAAPQLLDAMAAAGGFAARRACLAALRATRAPGALRALGAPRALDVLGAWADEARAEGHATFLVELLQVRGRRRGAWSA